MLWKVRHVQRWLIKQGDWAREYVAAFARENIKGRFLQHLTEKMLEESLHISNGKHRQQILTAIQVLKAKPMQDPCLLRILIA